MFDIVSAFFVLVFSDYSLSTTLRDMNEIWNNLSMIHEIMPAPRMSSVFVMTFHKVYISSVVHKQQNHMFNNCLIHNKLIYTIIIAE